MMRGEGAQNVESDQLHLSATSHMSHALAA